MSGWVKIEKDLESDPRVQRIAKLLCNAQALHASQGVTQVIGGLTRLWIHADTHIRDDNSLDMSTHEIDEWLGLPGFCKLLPADWLVDLQDAVELPGFQLHNGLEAKKKALTQKRVTRHRIKRQRKNVTPALPDQTTPRLDKTKTKPEEAGASGAVVPGVLNLHDSLPQTEWAEWLTLRRAKRWPVNELTLRKQLELLAAHSTEVQRGMLNYSMRAPYQGLFEPKATNGTGKPRKARFDELTEGASDAAHEDQGFG